MSGRLEFDQETSRRVEALYLTPDVVSQRRRVRELLRLTPGERVLDIGSGPGLLAHEMATQVGPGGQVCGIDTSEDMLAISRERCAEQPWDEHFAHAGLPRTLSRELRDAGLEVRHREVLPMFSPEYEDDTYAKGMLDIVASFAVGRRGVTQEEADAWRPSSSTSESGAGSSSASIGTCSSRPNPG
ncbi:MAG: methyltransferase domain-containing protein [Gaiellales bacterium]